MPDEHKTDDVEKLLTDQESLENRKQALIDDLLKQRAAAIAAFDEKLAKLGYQENSDKKRRRSHHKKSEKSGLDSPDAGTKATPKPKS